MPDPDFDRDTTLERVGSGQYRALVQPHWFVDRGPNGGFLAAIALKATEETVGDRQPCSLTLHYLTAPEAGTVDLSIEVVRTGRMLTSCTMRMTQDGRPVALGLIALVAPPHSSESFDDTVFPEVLAPEAAPPVTDDIPGLPPFLVNYDLRFAMPPPPPGQEPEASSGVWIRTAAPRAPDPIAVTAFSDAWVPSPYVRRGAPAPVATIDLTVHVRDHDWFAHAAEDDFVLGVFRSRRLANGLYEEDGELWNRHGSLLAQSRQLALLFG